MNDDINKVLDLIDQFKEDLMRETKMAMMFNSNERILEQEYRLIQELKEKIKQLGEKVK